jgi:predicted enzyme related to lactoylglutathione lyase
MGDRPRVTGIGGAFFKARDPQALAAWYATHLGVPVEAQGPYAVFHWKDDPARDGGATVWAVFDEGSDYFGRADQRFMVNFRVADLDATLSALRAESVEVDERIEDGTTGKFGWIRDPEGNRIELWQPPERG